jgi:hypothetical protein
MAGHVPAVIVDHFSDQGWRLDNLYWIMDKSGTRVQFKLNWAQMGLLENQHFLNIVLKARQLGFTTFIQLYILDSCVFYQDTRAGVIAHTLDDAKAIFRDKVKFPYDNLPEGIRAQSSIVKDNETTLELSNNSLIRVGTSLRGGTNQYLHISEFGKICAKYPERAREIITGALNTLEAGQMAWIESTAEGQEGRFYEMCQEAESKQRLGSKLSVLDWKFHFYPWWREPSYQLDPEGVLLTPELKKYFQEVESQGIILSDAQKAWYVKKAETQQEDMKREYPSTPKEAFEASIEGAYYSQQMSKAESEGRITSVPHDPRLQTETWWDLGMDDEMAIWFIQRFGRELRAIDYYSNSGEGLAHYAKVLKERDYNYSRHIGPHDIEVRELGTGKARKEVAETLGIKPMLVAPRLDVDDGIEAVRNLLPRFWFDQAKCAEGIKGLKAYRKEWDEDKGVWLPRPRHDWASHPADAFRTGAIGSDDRGPPKITVPKMPQSMGSQWMSR